MTDEKAANDDVHETVDQETESRKTIILGPGACRGLGEGPSPGHSTPCVPESSTHPDHNAANAENAKTSPAVRQPMGEYDPESELPCSCSRRTFVDPPEEMPMATTASDKKALEEFIRKHYKTSAFNTCKRQHWPITAVQPMKIRTPDDAVPMYCRKPTRVPLHFMKGVRAGCHVFS